MKNPWPLCGERKAQRRCLRQNNAIICSVCCAKTRDEVCADCSYHSAAQQYYALEIDPQYEPAMTNRVVIEQMEEGTALHAAGFQRIEFSRHGLKNV